MFRAHLPVLQHHNGVARLLRRVKPCEPQVFAFRAIRCELPGLRGTGLAASSFFQLGSILCGALFHHLLQHFTQERYIFRTHHPP